MPGPFQRSFRAPNPGYAFKQATLNPVNPGNVADPDEEKIIRFLSRERSVKSKRGIVDKSQKDYIYFAQPIVTKKECLKCHDRKEDAPKGQILRYPGL